MGRYLGKLESMFEQLFPSMQQAFLDIVTFYLDLSWGTVTHAIGEMSLLALEPESLDLSWGTVTQAIGEMPLLALEEPAFVKKRRSLDVDDIARVHVHGLLVSLGRKLEPGLRISSAGECHSPTLLKTDHGDKKDIEGLCLRKCKDELPTESLDMLQSTSLRLAHPDPAAECGRVVPKSAYSIAHLQLFITQGSMPFKHIEQPKELAVLRLCEVDIDFDSVQVRTHPWMVGRCWHVKLIIAASFVSRPASLILRFTDIILDVTACIVQEYEIARNCCFVRLYAKPWMCILRQALLYTPACIVDTDCCLLDPILNS